MQFVAMDTSRDPKYIENHLLSYLAQDFVESLAAIPVLVEQGIHNVALREARFILEASIKMCAVQQSSPTTSITEKLIRFQGLFDSSSISVKKKITLSFLPEDHRDDFQVEVGRAYGLTSNYVHLTLHQMQERLARLDAGKTAGKDDVDDVASLNRVLTRIYSCALVLLFHSVPAYVAGDWFVERDGSTAEWFFTRSRFLSMIDAAHDYKFERQCVLKEVALARKDSVAL